jgi:hypothetical protein
MPIAVIKGALEAQIKTYRDAEHPSRQGSGPAIGVKKKPGVAGL